MRAISRGVFFVGLGILAAIVWEYMWDLTRGVSVWGYLARLARPEGRFTDPALWRLPLHLVDYARLVTVILGILLIGQSVAVRLFSKNDHREPGVRSQSPVSPAIQGEKYMNSISQGLLAVGLALFAFVAWGLLLFINDLWFFESYRETSIFRGRPLMFTFVEEYFQGRQGSLELAIVILGILLLGQFPIVRLLSRANQGKRGVHREPLLAPATHREESDPALGILKERLASGDIDVQEYERIRAALKEE
jgi:hypothetical protein